MQAYESAQLEIIAFEAEDVITESSSKGYITTPELE